MDKTRSSTLERVKYEVRSGTSNYGRDYELNMLTLLALRCTRQNFDGFWLGTNVDGVGDFDDILLHIKETPKSAGFTYFVQLKYSSKAKSMNKNEFVTTGRERNDFSIVRYSEKFSKLKETLLAKSSDIIINNIEQSTTKFVLFTNRPSFKYDFLENNSDNWCFLLNTCNNSKNIYKFNLEKLKGNSPLDNLDYCENIRLFCNQANIEKLSNLIIGEFEKLIARLGLENKLDLKCVSDNFKNYINDWARGDLSESFYLTKHDITWKLSQILFEKFLFNLEPTNFQFNYRTEIWKEITKNKRVTFIASDDEVVVFFKHLINREVNQYFDTSNKSVTYILTDLEKAKLCNDDHALEVKMLSIIGKHGKVTIKDIYKLFFFCGRLPLLLEANDVQNCEVILKIHKFSNYDFNIIILSNSPEFVQDLNCPVKHFFALDDLDSEEQKQILNLPIKFQDRPFPVLGNLIDVSLYHHIKARDVIHILAGNFNVGNYNCEFSNISPYFIKRSLSRVLFEPEMVKQLHTENFVIENLNKLPIDKKIFRNNVAFVKSSQQLEELKNEGKSFHHLRYLNNGYFEWIETFGTKKNMRRNQLIQNHSVHDFVNIKSMLVPTNKISDVDALWIDLEEIFDNKIIIINAAPGMGKTTLMDYVAAKAPLDMWVLNINLNAYEDYYKDKMSKSASAYDHLHFFNTAILEKFGCRNIKLAQKLFAHFLHMKKILILVDGFDEITISHIDRATKIIKALHTQGFAIWLTTRPLMQQHLEEEFDTFSRTLKPWSKNDQETFLLNYFKNSIPGANNHERILKEFVQKLIETAQTNLNDHHCKFTSVPLQSKLLSDVFLNDCKTSFSSAIVDFNKKFDLVDLYQEFISMKTDILCTKFGKDAERTRSLFEEHQQLFALKTLFPDEYLMELNIDGRFEEYYEGQSNNIHFLQRDGFLEVTYKHNFRFVHRSFAEYLAGVWLSKHVKQKNETKAKKIACNLMAKRFGWTGKESYGFLFSTFDHLVAKNSPLHLKVLNGRIDEVGKMIKHNPKLITDIDNCGRSILHLLALYGKHHPAHGVLKTQQYDDEIIKILEVVPNEIIADIKNDFVGHSLLYYAIASGSLAIANKICEKSNVFTIKNLIDRSLRFTFCNYCVKFEYRSLFKVLLPYFSSEDIFLRFMDKDISVGSYCSVSNDVEVHRLNMYLNEIGLTTESKIFQFVNHYFDELQIAVAFGPVTQVDLLLKTKDVDVNKEDMHKNTLLHYATIHERLETVKLLLNRGADVNKPGKDNNTALHYAAGRGDYSTVLTLLNHGADVNKINSNGNTSLNLAFIKRYKEITRLLISKGSDCAVIDKQGRSALHLAVIMRDYNIVAAVLNNEIDINQADYYSETPILIAVRYGYRNIAKLLLSKGADANISNDTNEFCLYYAVKNGDNDMVKELISKGADVSKSKNGDTLFHVVVQHNHQSILRLLLQNEPNVSNRFGKINYRDTNGNTPLHLALIKGQQSIAELLLLEEPNVHVENNAGSTCLHYAAEKGFNEILSKMLLLGADIDKTNKDGNVALILALISNQVDTVKLLLDNGAQADVENSNGNSPLHFAACTNGGIDILAELISKGASVNKQNRQGETPLHFAIGFLKDFDNVLNMNEDRLDILKLVITFLLEKGASVNIKQIHGYTPLHLVCLASQASHRRRISNNFNQKGYGNVLIFCEDMAELFLLKGADVSLKDCKSCSALNYAEMFRWKKMVAILSN